jgi:hypothetical protein
MTEYWMIAAMGLGGICFAIGGTGWKPARRFLLPIILGFVALFNGFSWQMCLGYALTQSIVLCLPYGERTPYWAKFLVFLSYPLPSLFFGFTWWQPITAVVCFGCFCFSNWKPTAQTFFWKACEFIMGASIGITVAALIAQMNITG